MPNTNILEITCPKCLTFFKMKTVGCKLLSFYCPKCKTDSDKLKTNKLLLLNTTIAIPKNPTSKIIIHKIDNARAKGLINYYKNFFSENNIISAIGHSGTAEVLTLILNIQVATNRIQASCEPNDITLCFKLKERLPEGIVLSKEELEKLDYDFWVMLYEKLP